MRKTLYFAMLALMLLAANSFGKEKFLVVTEEWPPYVIDLKTGASGFDYDVVKTVVEKMGYELDFKFVPWKRCIAMIQNKEADAILDVSVNDERKAYMYFPTEVLSESNTVLFYKKEKNLKYDKIDDLKGLTIGTSLGYSYSDEFNKSTLFKKDEVKDHEANFKKLMIDRIDAFVVNKNVGLFTAKEMGILNDLSYSKQSVSGGDNHLGFSKKAGHDKLVELFSKTLKEFKKTKEYKDILAKYGQ